MFTRIKRNILDCDQSNVECRLRVHYILVYCYKAALPFSDLDTVHVSHTLWNKSPISRHMSTLSYSVRRQSITAGHT